ncbi:aldo/keto reductase [Microlunatus soli]|uniref:Predicted oxidoreductase n=1 Tax=Microlunatus soli TaxID=630515 RepID=A0A1H1VFK2_9ACTN|nr:aldo/keto reductase [Microlunatus soli]SDS83503.1 Predicted oxidoreductase [Microlunatus soli]
MDTASPATAPRSLGAEGSPVSAIGFGCWAIGGPHWRNGDPIGWGEVDDDESIAAVRAALDAGITFFDTADVYGCGHSERVLARALKGHRDEVVIATKFGYTYDEERRESPGTDASPDYIRRACEASLRRLDADVLDLYQFHLGGEDLSSAAAVRDTLEDLVSEGKIKAYGWSTDDPERAAFFAEGEHCKAIQQAFNVLGGNEDTLAVAERDGLASIVRGPLGMGLLTGRMDRDTTFSDSDVRRGWDFSGSHGDQLGKLERIRDILTADGRTLAQGSLGWLLARSPAFVPIPGIRTVAQAEENAGVLAVGPLSSDQLAEIDTVLQAAD